MFLDVFKLDSIPKGWFPAYVIDRSILINSWRDNIMFVVLKSFEQLECHVATQGRGMTQISFLSPKTM